MKKLTDDKVQALVQQYLREYKESLENRYYETPDYFIPDIAPRLGIDEKESTL